MDLDRQTRLNEVARIAVRLEAETRVPAQAIVAQWALESHWGAKPVGHANYFGIKKAARHAQCCTVTTHEVVNGERQEATAEFADYPDLEASCRDYAWLVSHGGPYAKAWAAFQFSRNAEGLLRGIARVYATDPNYAELACDIASQPNVQEAIKGARV